VINYDFPQSPEDYVHRIGRTARVEASGLATSFVTRSDRRFLPALERLVGAKLPLVPNPVASQQPPREHGGQRHPSRRRGQGGSRERRPQHAATTA
jgi:ATP-dependent RNA helicase RhlE